jgi:carbon monoxide dehydrogenase subunit G
VNLEYNGTERIDRPRDTVWAFITDPARIASCLPDAVETTVHDDKHFDAIVQVGVGPVRGKFKMKFELIPAPDGRRLDMKISGGGFGSALDLTAGADVVPEGDATTILNWDGKAVARGPVAAVGGRVLDAQAQKLIAQTFATVRERLSAASA